MDNPEQAQKKKTNHMLTKLKQLGIGLSLDDFGTGYGPSLAPPKPFPVRHDQDRQELRRRQRQSGPLLKIEWSTRAHELGLSVVAEERHLGTKLDFRVELRQMGCEYVQSFMFSAPIPGVTVVLKMLRGAIRSRRRNA